MIRLREVALSLVPVSAGLTVGCVIGAVVAFVLGAELVGGCLYVLAGVAIIPWAAAGWARPRPGLLWYGSVAEPQRTERSPGEML